MLLISVIVCSLVAAAYLFVPEFQGGVAALAQDVSVMLANGQVGGIGFARHGGGGGGGGSMNGVSAGGGGGPALAAAPSSVPDSDTGSGTTNTSSNTAGSGPTMGHGAGISPWTAAPVFDRAPTGPTLASGLGNPPPPSSTAGTSPSTAAHEMGYGSPVALGGGGGG